MSITYLDLSKEKIEIIDPIIPIEDPEYERRLDYNDDELIRFIIIKIFKQKNK